MKNVSPYQFGKVIIKCFDDYVYDVRHACGDLTADVRLDGSVNGIVKGIVPMEQLAAYYDVKRVIDVHASGTFNDIWIAYED